ncbi:hypothetical protein RFI_06772, partial [Reticulomyxa filosa]
MDSTLKCSPLPCAVTSKNSQKIIPSTMDTANVYLGGSSNHEATNDTNCAMEFSKMQVSPNKTKLEKKNKKNYCVFQCQKKKKDIIFLVLNVMTGTLNEASASVQCNFQADNKGTCQQTVTLKSELEKEPKLLVAGQNDCVDNKTDHLKQTVKEVTNERCNNAKGTKTKKKDKRVILVTAAIITPETDECRVLVEACTPSNVSQDSLMHGTCKSTDHSVNMEHRDDISYSMASTPTNTTLRTTFSADVILQNSVNEEHSGATQTKRGQIRSANVQAKERVAESKPDSNDHDHNAHLSVASVNCAHMHPSRMLMPVTATSGGHCRKRNSLHQSDKPKHNSHNHLAKQPHHQPKKYCATVQHESFWLWDFYEPTGK